jgi:hypothetical protein
LVGLRKDVRGEVGETDKEARKVVVSGERLGLGGISGRMARRPGAREGLIGKRR